jgi:streptomycin 6-kinase
VASTPRPVLLHGDLHPGNVLRDRDRWRAIDPKGVVGDPCYDAVAFLREGILERPDPLAQLRLRLDTLCGETGLERSRVLAWGVAQTVLSAWWSIEDQGDRWQPAIAWARLFETLRAQEGIEGTW